MEKFHCNQIKTAYNKIKSIISCIKCSISHAWQIDRLDVIPLMHYI